MTRLATVAADSQFVRIARIPRLVSDAVLARNASKHQGDEDAAAEADYGFGFANKSLEKAHVILTVLKWRDDRKLDVFESGGVGLIWDADIWRGALKFEQARALLREAWNVELRLESGGSHLVGSTNDQALPIASSSAPAGCPSPPGADVAAEATDGIVAARRDLCTDDICEVFDGLGRTYAEWSQTINKNRPPWLTACVTRPGRSGNGSRQATWDPLKIAIALVTGKPRKGHVSAAEVECVFRSQQVLKPWLDDWVEYRLNNPLIG